MSYTIETIWKTRRPAVPAGLEAAVLAKIKAREVAERRRFGLFRRLAAAVFLLTFPAALYLFINSLAVSGFIATARALAADLGVALQNADAALALLESFPVDQLLLVLLSLLISAIILWRAAPRETASRHRVFANL